MNGNCFVDTKILLYARDASEPEKQPVAEALLRELWEQRTGRISVQVLNEYFVNATAKLDPGIEAEAAWEDIEDLQAWAPLPVDFDVMALGFRIRQRYGLSWWDALIVAAAELTGSRIIYSEDLADGQSYRNMKVVNPFKVE